MTCVKTTIKNRGEEFIVPGYLLVLLHGSCAAAGTLEAAAASPVGRSCGVLVLLAGGGGGGGEAGEVVHVPTLPTHSPTHTPLHKLYRYS